jgi:hypothetical protein
VARRAGAGAVDDGADVEEFDLMAADPSQPDADATAVGLERDNRAGTEGDAAGRLEVPEPVGDVGRHAEAVDVPEPLQLVQEAPPLLGPQRLP